MFTEWLETENASWDQLLEALRSPGVQLMDLANHIEQMLAGKYVYANNKHACMVIGLSS